MSPKNPSTTFFFNDWENDPELRTCSLAAQGIWMRLLCIAARSPEPGVVQIGSLNCSLPEGLPHVAAAVGRPLQEIASLIDELIASRAADRDRKGRIVCRRMKRAASLALKRSESGKLGAAAKHGKETTISGLPWQNAGKPPSKPVASSRLQSSDPPQGSETGTDPARNPCPVWSARLDGYRPWEGVKTWSAFWGLPPDSAGINPSIPTQLLAAWRARNALEIGRLRARPAPATQAHEARQGSTEAGSTT